MRKKLISYWQCCKKFRVAVESGDIYAGILAPNVSTWMSRRERMLQNKLLSGYVNFAGADGVAWEDCPFCNEKLISPRKTEIKTKERMLKIVMC